MHIHTYLISYISKELIGVRKCMGLEMQLRISCLLGMCVGLGLRASTPKKKKKWKQNEVRLRTFNDENPRTTLSNSRNNFNIVLQMLRHIFSIYNIPRVI